MKKILIGVIGTIGLFALLGAVILKKTDAPSILDINQNRADKALLVSAEKEREFIENRILGISYVASVLANTGSTLPSVLRDKILDDQQVLSETKASLETVIKFLDEGNAEAADNAYRLIETNTVKATTASYQRRNKIRDDFRVALNEHYRNGRIYTESEWEVLKRNLRGKLTDRNTEAARRAYLMQPADNAQFDYLRDQLEVLGETEELVFFYKLNYEVSYELLKNSGSLSYALGYGVALYKFTKENERIIEVLKGPVTQIMSAPTVDATRYSEPLSAYLSVLKKQGKAKEFKQFSQTIIDSIQNNILALDKQVPSTGKMVSFAPSVKADFRVQGASLLYELDLVDDAITLVKEAKNFYESSDTQKLAEMNRLIEKYQQSPTQE